MFLLIVVEIRVTTEFMTARLSVDKALYPSICPLLQASHSPTFNEAFDYGVYSNDEFISTLPKGTT